MPSLISAGPDFNLQPAGRPVFHEVGAVGVEPDAVLLNAAVDADDLRGHCRDHVHAPRAHRETTLILSLIHALRGQADQALTSAQEGITLGERLNSPFVTAVAHIRLAHALQLRREKHDEAIRHYQESIALGDQIAVRRTRAEAMWGLTRVHGFFGDLDAARQTAAEGREICQWAGDVWVSALIEVTLGASIVLADQPADAIEAAVARAEPVSRLRRFVWPHRRALVVKPGLLPTQTLR